MTRWTTAILTVFSFIYLTSCTSTQTTTKPEIPIPVPSHHVRALNLYDGIDSLTTKLIESVHASPHKNLISKITVADFIGPGDEIFAFGEHLSDKLGVSLFSAHIFPEFMERKQLRQVLNSLKLEHGGYFDQSSVKKFGKMIGVDGMVIGTIEDLGSVVDLTTKIVESETGRIIGMADVQLIKDQLVLSLIKKQRTATLTISITPPVYGTVVADGQRGALHQGMVTFTHIPYGDCQILIQPEGFEPVRRNISVGSRNESLAVNLKIKKCDVSFQIIPPDAKLSVNGKKIALNDQGFARLQALPAKDCSYVVNAEGYQSRIETFKPCQHDLITLDLHADDAFYGIKKIFFKKYQIVKKQQSFSIKLWTDKSAYRLNDPIRFFFRTERNCYLNLVNIGSSGNVTLLFPNRYHSDNFVRAGVTYRIPDDHYGFSFQVEPPLGTERVYAIASTRPIDIFDMDFRNMKFMSRTRGNTRDIGVTKIGNRLDQADLNAAAECIIYKKGN